MSAIGQEDILRVKLAVSDFEENLQFVAGLQAQRDALLVAVKDLRARLQKVDDLDVCMGERVGSYEAINRADAAILQAEAA